MIIDVMSDIVDPFLFILHKLVIKVVEVRELLKERHKLLVATFLLDFLTVLEP
jgi:hypothetical protein